jgi:hypothetical protein
VRAEPDQLGNGLEPRALRRCTPLFCMLQIRSNLDAVWCQSTWWQMAAKA